MPKFTYIIKRIAGMDYGAMVRTAKTVHERTGKNTLAVLADIIPAAFDTRQVIWIIWSSSFTP